MDDLLQQLAADPWGRLILQHLAAGGLRGCFLFFLVLARLTGLFVVAPFATTSPISLPIRAGLAVLLSPIIVATLSHAPAVEGSFMLTAHQINASDVPAGSTPDLPSLIINEVALGTVLGIGVLTVVSGLKLAGEWLDRHSGLGLGTVLNPDWSSGELACSRLIPLIGLAVFLLIEPLGGQWLLLRSLADSFQEIPLGSATWSVASLDLFNRLVPLSLVLGIRVAIPLVATMLAVDLTLAFASRNSPLAVSSAALAMKAGTGLIVLAFTLTAIPDVIAATIFSLFG